MRTRYLVTISAVSGFSLFSSGCSKSSNAQPHNVATPPNMTDLGAVELTAQTSQHFSLGAGKGCTITGKQLADGIEVKLVVLATNADGTVQRSQGQIETLPGRQCAISIGDTMVGLTPTLKAQ